jgi:hypothetical protein
VEVFIDIRGTGELTMHKRFMALTATALGLGATLAFGAGIVRSAVAERGAAGQSERYEYPETKALGPALSVDNGRFAGSSEVQDEQEGD